MTVQTAASAAYIVAALLFILALAGLSRHETARAGNTFGIAGMAIALVATLVLAISGGFTALQVGLLIGAVVIGAAVGLYRAARVYALAAARQPAFAPEGGTYRRRAVELVLRALDRTPTAARPAFWRDYVKQDGALAEVRRDETLLRLAAEYDR